LLAITVRATVGGVLVLGAHEGLLWMLPVDAATLFAAMMSGLVVGSLLIIYYLVLAFRFPPQLAVAHRVDGRALGGEVGRVSMVHCPSWTPRR
jgi:hypothetical protein